MENNFENTMNDLRDCLVEMREEKRVSVDVSLGEREKSDRRMIIRIAIEIAEEFGKEV